MNLASCKTAFVETCSETAVDAASVGAKSPSHSSSNSAKLIFGMTKNGAYAPFLTAERLFIAGLVCGIVKCLDLRDTLETGGVNLGDPVLNGCALNVVSNLAVARTDSVVRRELERVEVRTIEMKGFCDFLLVRLPAIASAHDCLSELQNVRAG